MDDTGADETTSAATGAAEGGKDATTGKGGKGGKLGGVKAAFRDNHLLAPAVVIAFGLIANGMLSGGGTTTVSATPVVAAPVLDGPGQATGDTATGGHADSDHADSDHGDSDHSGSDHGDSDHSDSGQAGDDGHGDTAPHWSYEGASGPEAWGSLSPDYAMCVDGSAQSPIDITTPIPFGLEDLAFAYQPTTVAVRDTGHALQADVEGELRLVLEGVPYDLVQVHFHAPSEHTVNGRNYPAEGHFVHKALDGTLAVVGVMLTLGDANAGFGALLDAAAAGQGETTPVEGIDLTGLLPVERGTIRYAGSLTTPPCSEDVKWNLMVNPVSISQEQLDGLRAIHDGNNRPTQPLNGRPVVLDSGPDA
jgi:carbonic anhydrase